MVSSFRFCFSFAQTYTKDNNNNRTVVPHVCIFTVFGLIWNVEQWTHQSVWTRLVGDRMGDIQVSTIEQLPTDVRSLCSSRGDCLTLVHVTLLLLKTGPAT